MSRLWCLTPLLVVGLFGTGFLMGDDKRETIVVRATLPRYYTQLGLSPKQRNELYKIRGKYGAEIQELYEKINDLREKEKQDCEKVLTSAQRARLKELLVGSDRRKIADDDETPPAKVEKKSGTADKNQKKGAELKGKSDPAEIKKP